MSGRGLWVRVSIKQFPPPWPAPSPSLYFVFLRAFSSSPLPLSSSFYFLYFSSFPCCLLDQPRLSFTQMLLRFCLETPLLFIPPSSLPLSVHRFFSSLSPCPPLSLSLCPSPHLSPPPHSELTAHIGSTFLSPFCVFFFIPRSSSRGGGRRSDGGGSVYVTGGDEERGD